MEFIVSFVRTFFSKMCSEHAHLLGSSKCLLKIGGKAKNFDLLGKSQIHFVFLIPKVIRDLVVQSIEFFLVKRCLAMLVDILSQCLVYRLSELTILTMWSMFLDKVFPENQESWSNSLTRLYHRSKWKQCAIDTMYLVR